jgi:hypothetical protein
MLKDPVYNALGQAAPTCISACLAKKNALAIEHLTEAKRIMSQFGQTPILARVDAALNSVKPLSGRCG